MPNILNASTLDLDPESPPLAKSALAEVCTIQSLNQVLESIIVILRNPERNLVLIEKFDFYLLVSQILETIDTYCKKGEAEQLEKTSIDQSMP